MTQKATLEWDDELRGIQDADGTPADRAFTQTGFAMLGFPCQARLTLTTALPVTTADVTAAGTLYWTPYKGNSVALYYNSAWYKFALTEKSLALTLTSGSVYDVFGYFTGTAPAIETLVWTNTTTRATALTTQDGVLVKSGDATRRYLGTIVASGTNTTEDSISKRYVYNYYNRVPRTLKAVDTTNSWAYTTAAYQEARAGSTLGTSRVGFVIGWNEDIVTAQAVSAAGTSSGSVAVACGIGLDSATNVATVNCSTIAYASVIQATPFALYRASVAVGAHYLAWLEYGGANVSFYGDNGASVFQTGLVAEVWA